MRKHQLSRIIWAMVRFVLGKATISLYFHNKAKHVAVVARDVKRIKLCVIAVNKTSGNYKVEKWQFTVAAKFINNCLKKLLVIIEIC